jgi:hypothetical protein
MKLKLLFTLVLLVSLSTSHAQFGLDKLKNKVKSSTSSGDTKDAAKENAAKLDKSNPENSPAVKSIRKFRNDFSFAEDAINKKHPDADSRVANLEKVLAQIKTEDPGWVDYDKDEAEFKRLKAKYEKMNEGLVMNRRLEDARSCASSITRSPNKASDTVYAECVDKVKFEEVKAYYNSHPEELTDFRKGTLASMDNFYANDVPKIKQSLLQKTEDYTKAVYYLKEARAKADYLKNKGWGSFNPEGDMNTIKEGIKFVDGTLLFLPGDKELSAVQKLLNDRKTDIEQYMASPEYKADIAKRKQMDIDEVLITKPEMNDPSLEAVVKRDFNTKTWGTIKRISLYDRGWIVIKNSLGLPLEKVINVEVGTSQEGKCYRVSGRLVSPYEGGGKYGKPNFIVHLSYTEMNCANMNKNGTK